MGAVAGKGRERACKHLFNDTLPPTFSKFLDSWISAVKLWKCQIVGIVLKFLARVFAQSRYANARKYSCLLARLIFRFCENKILTFIGTKVPRISLLDVVKNKELLVFTGGHCLVFTLSKRLDSAPKVRVSCLTCSQILTRIYAMFRSFLLSQTGGISSCYVKLYAKHDFR